MDGKFATNCCKLYFENHQENKFDKSHYQENMFFRGVKRSARDDKSDAYAAVVHIILATSHFLPAFVCPNFQLDWFTLVVDDPG